ncbi:acyltransferase family protein [Endozoicomonadaceae bacterium StTr2]
MLSTYRRDIDGLRAVAVSLVILYHYKFAAFSGGFVGVDVFFVITGFVISGILMRHLAEGRFSFFDFTARRIKRLLPAFLVVSFVSFLLISPFYMDEDYYIFSKSWLFALVGYSNFYFLDEFAKYFSSDAEVLTLLHTWSLGIEMQFYVIWPLLLWGLWRYIKTQAGISGFIVLLISAFGFSVYQTHTSPNAAYFLLPARLFELLLGAGLAIYGEHLPRLNRTVSEILSSAGLSFIIFSAMVLETGDLFPGYNALLPTLGTVMIIYSGMFDHRGLVSKVLSTRGLVFIGALSYSIYLWHWPPVALMNYQLIELTLFNQILLIGFTLLAAWATYTFVEARLRYRPWGLKASFLNLVLVPALMIWGVQATIRIADDISFRIPEKNRELYRIMNQQNADDIFDACFDGDNIAFDKSEACLTGKKTADGEPTAILVGDSHGTSMVGFLEELSKSTDLYTLIVTKASTPFILGKHTQEALRKDKKVARNKALQDYLSQGKPKTVFVSAWWHSYLNDERYQLYFMDMLGWLKELGHTVVFLEDVPTLPSTSYAYCALKNRTNCSIPYEDAEKQMENFYRFRANAMKRFPDVIWINPRQAMCNERRCETILEGIPLYRDDNHLNYIGSKVLGKAYLKQYENPLEALGPSKKS